MRCRRLALGLGCCLLVGAALGVLWVYAENWLPFSYVPYYLPCPAIFNMKLQYRGEKPFQPVAWSQYPQPKLLEQRPTNLLTLTPWLAPIVSEGTFDRELLHNIYRPLNLTVGLTVFAVGKYTGFVQHFLESAERFFMHGYHVCYYLFTDDPAAIPQVALGPGRNLSVIRIQKYSRFEEISMRRMETISRHIAQRAHWEVDYLFCVDVDMVFWNHWGPETLGDLVAAIHPGYYSVPRQQFPYERRHVSTAFVPESEGDFYYGGAVFGGRVDRVYEFTRGCHMAILADKANGIMAAWQEESHLNRRFISHKPSKVLSPEYLWDDRKPQPPSLKLIRFSTLDKNSNWLRS
ncbi:globoside alpha-1,3-N-acetylgalactosaminyltransferase 1 [Pteronotus mesoamericanus]|uniref:globoside alpha-1,3-N-acetylgalactosaminyltransferase 1 n=1 Tax=Pteronotus mesoamericanus TaxID=1884717 RepID=UPI0023EB0CB6|nr:globoside alpha-1,3-N-acetylgalactosaminyltransferase 1 [Pteronotus parnellii mesoamericanus]XP_054440143.1 globoside alpha-1,3-N-acetylgalactosaminyltransferase 1 [Pteronotus parnellii mesoamericanus]XP_054440144.1 globoside alpha-1,3-N-acetylgalactosaminyltransferase 1 [Pteronotus parnellii mesoamericanus]XP_054440145.1 globoside alpha-1,3-N-acetylgalactosaminyltransferase 1 [Pteronotus parnellii mesoamericanus]XP_054440147.1 globoside alpha-1,3-N-acetylgalactosaminyltransferase 1 [Pterono